MDNRDRRLNGRSLEQAIEDMRTERLALASRLHFCDAAVWLGEPQGYPLAREMSLEALESAHAALGIEGGLLSHWSSKIMSAQDGNAALARIQAALKSRWRAVWTGLPLLPDEAGPLPGPGAKAERLGGVRIFPKTHGFPLTPWMLDSLCEWLTTHRLPLFIWHTELEWPLLHNLACAFPRLTIVIESQPQKILYHARPLFGLLQACANIRVETSNFVGQGCIEYVVRHWGPERLLFGTFLPAGDPLVPMGMLLDADIDEADKVLIAGENLRRLWSEIRA